MFEEKIINLVISQTDYDSETAIKKFVPEITTKTLNRIIMLTLMGPIFGWFLLASFILKVSTHESDNTKKIKQLIYKPLV